MKKKIKVVAFSDCHGLHNDIVIPDCDILIFAGDFCIDSEFALERAKNWFYKQSASHYIFVAGNHDTYLESIGKESTIERFGGITYLENDLLNLDGLRIYGSSYTPFFNGWAFSYQRQSLEAKNLWSKIPYNLDFLITHGAAQGILDRNLNDERCGCSTLLREIDNKKPKRHIFGHLHLFGGQSTTQEDIDFYNVSVLNEDYKLVNKPTIIEV